MAHKRAPLGALNIVAAIGIAGCGATNPSAPPTPVATASPSATPAATPNLTSTAAAAYLAAATTANAAQNAIYKAYPKTFTSLAQAKHYWSQIEAVERTFLTTIFAISYPSFMKADVDAQIADETKVVADYAQLAANPNDSVAYAANQSDNTTATGAANIVRHDLGLPQVPLT
jgi:hypothetical protein